MSLAIESVLISEPVDPSCGAILSKHGIKVTTKVGLSPNELRKEIENYDGLIVRSATKVTADIIQAGKNLKIIGRAGVGVDNIDCNAATKQGVLVINAPGGNTLSAAELTCAMITSLSRNIPEACASLKSGKWDRKRFMANELSEKTLAIIGLGRIGREVAHRMQAFGMTTIGFDPLVPAEESIQFGVTSYELEKIWPKADYITVHTPLIPQTKNMLNKETFAKCPKGVKVVNCARGGIIDEDALLDALESGQCGGAGLDVYLEEPPRNTKLIQHPKVICTPHLGASTHEAQSRVAEEISEQMVSLKNGQSAHGIVNSPAFCLSMSSANKSAVTLSKSLGSLVSALFPTSEEVSLTINVHGSDLRRKDVLFSTAVLIGMLKQRNVIGNFVNAPTLAGDLNIKVAAVITGPPKCSASSLSVNVVATSSNRSHSISATLKGEEPVLCDLDGFVFKNHPALIDNLILLKGSASGDILKLLGTLVETSVVDCASWSSFSDGKVWCAINSSYKYPHMPAEATEHLKNLGQQLEFWAQLNI